MNQHALQLARAREVAFRASVRGMLADMMGEPAAALDELDPRTLTDEERDMLACWLDRSAWLWVVEAMCVQRQQAIKAQLRALNGHLSRENYAGKT